MKEIWKTIEGYGERYQVSNLGRVKSVKGQRPKKLRQTIGKDGYFVVHLNHKKVKVHRLVALAFCDGYADNLVVGHKDENRLNNRADNLEWISQKKNNNTPLHRDRIKQAKGIAVWQLDNEGRRLARFDSIAQAARISGADNHTITNDIKGIPRRKSKYRWIRA